MKEIDGEASMLQIFGVLWRSKFLILITATMASCVAAFVSFQMPDIYRAEVLLAPAEDAHGGVSALGQFSGLASLAGVNMPRTGPDKTTIALEVLKSRLFITDFIKRRNLYVPLLAVRGVEPESGNIVVDNEIYDQETDSWKGKYSSGEPSRPNVWLAYKKFKEILRVDQVKATGLISVSVDHQSPVLAKKWVQWLIDDINNQLRTRDVDEAEKSLSFLKNQIEKTSFSEIRQILYQLIERQTQTVMLANVREQYVLKMIDAPMDPQEKIGPKRFLIVSFVFVFSVMIMMALVMLRNAVLDKDNTTRNTNI